MFVYLFIYICIIIIICIHTYVDYQGYAKFASAQLCQADSEKHFMCSPRQRLKCVG